LFFVLSGFLITGILLSTKDKPHYFKTFYARRTLRIFPVYYLFLLGMAAVFIAVPFMQEQFASLYAAQAWYWVYLQNSLSAFSTRKGFDAAFAGPFWSLAVEEQFYIFWPLLVWALDRRRLLFACIGLIALALALRLGIWFFEGTMYGQEVSYFSTFTRIDALAMGALVAIALSRDTAVVKNGRYSKALLFPSLIGLAVIVGCDRENSLWGNWPMVTVGLTLTGTASAGLLLYGLSSPASVGGQLLRMPWLMAVGKYSYAIYIFHGPVFRATNACLLNLGLRGPMFISAFAALAAGTTLALSLLSWHLVEKNCLALRPKFGKPLADFPAPQIVLGQVAERNTTGTR
jgi:peptidoglycan/LPS O-acetylase OafA/YrhL